MPPPGDPRGRRVAGALLAAAGLVGVVLAGVVLALGGSADVLGPTEVSPQPGFVPGAVDALVAIVRAVRAVAPFAALLGLAVFFATWSLGALDRRRRLVARLARIEYSGIDRVSGRESPRGPARWVRRQVRGTGLAVLAIVLVGATSGIENEVTNGPLRPVEALTDTLADGRPVTFVLQGPDITFMDDSAIEVARMGDLVDDAPFPMIPFGKHLFNLDGKSALQLSIPDAVFARLSGEAVSSTCVGRTVLVDDTVGSEVGETISLNGTRLRVAGVLDGVAQMNRSIAILADSTARDCVLHGTSSAFFGAIALTGDRDAVDDVLVRAQVEASAVTEAHFLEENRDFWRANATPLILQLILYLALFSGFAAAGERQSALQRNIREIGMLNATGVDFRALQAIEMRRALSITVRATVIAAPLMVPVAAAFNASELGVQIGVGLVEVSVGFSITLVAMLAASRRALSQFRRRLDLPMAVKG
ncbi:hypothetical protein [Nocardioides sp.]|uniref:hypothetical protein n=1 Tax=Nocardioides sp. TaxID=35761 RepID=UPI003511E4AC